MAQAADVIVEQDTRSRLVGVCASVHVDLIFTQMTLADAKVIKALDISELAQIARAEVRLREYLLAKWNVRVSEASAEAGRAIAAGKNVDAAMSRVDTVMGRWAGDVRKIVDSILDSVYRLGREAGYKRALGIITKRLDYGVPESDVQKAKKVPIDSVVHASFNTQDKAAIATLQKQENLWIGRHYGENVSKIIREGASSAIKTGVGREAAGRQMQTYVKEKLSTVGVPSGWRGSDKAYFEGLAANAITNARVQGQLESFHRLGVVTYEIVNPMDNRTTPFCASINGTFFTVQEGMAQLKAYREATTPSAVKAAHPWGNSNKTIGGKSPKQLAASGQALPPYHFRCRTTIDIATTSYAELSSKSSDKSFNEAANNWLSSGVAPPLYDEGKPKYWWLHEANAKRAAAKDAVRGELSAIGRQITKAIQPLPTPAKEVPTPAKEAPTPAKDRYAHLREINAKRAAAKAAAANAETAIPKSDKLLLEAAARETERKQLAKIAQEAAKEAERLAAAANAAKEAERLAKEASLKKEAERLAEVAKKAQLLQKAATEASRVADKYASANHIDTSHIGERLLKAFKEKGPRGIGGILEGIEQLPKSAQTEVRTTIREILKSHGFTSQDVAQERTLRDFFYFGKIPNGANHNSGSGHIVVRATDRQQYQELFSQMAKGKDLTVNQANRLRTLLHEELHGASPIGSQATSRTKVVVGLEEAGTELLARGVARSMFGVDDKGLDSMHPWATPRYANGEWQQAGGSYDRYVRAVYKQAEASGVPNAEVKQRVHDAFKAMRTSDNKQEHVTPEAYVNSFVKHLGLEPKAAKEFMANKELGGM